MASVATSTTLSATSAHTSFDFMTSPLCEVRVRPVTTLLGQGLDNGDRRRSVQVGAAGVLEHGRQGHNSKEDQQEPDQCCAVVGHRHVYRVSLKARVALDLLLLRQRHH